MPLVERTANGGGKTPEATLLVVEDEPNILDCSPRSLRFTGFEVVTATNGADAVRPRGGTARPDRAGRDAARHRRLRRARRLRAAGHRTPVLFLTARDAVQDRIKGLTIGGDDYVTKPFSLEEVIARIRAVLRRFRGGGGRADAAHGVRRHRAGRGQPRGVARRASRSSCRRPSSSCCATSWPTPAASCPRRRSSTTCGTTTSAATPASSSPTSPRCAARSTTPSRRLIHTLRGVGYVLREPARPADAARLRSAAQRAANAGDRAARPGGRGGRRFPWPRRGLSRRGRRRCASSWSPGCSSSLTVGMTVMAGASASVLRQYLVGRADDQLRGSVGRTDGPGRRAPARAERADQVTTASPARCTGRSASTTAARSGRTRRGASAAARASPTTCPGGSTSRSPCRATGGGLVVADPRRADRRDGGDSWSSRSAWTRSTAPSAASWLIDAIVGVLVLVGAGRPRRVGRPGQPAPARRDRGDRGRDRRRGPVAARARGPTRAPRWAGSASR